MSRTHKTKEVCCPVCSAIFDGAMGINNNDKPKTGDLTVCSYCASFLTFTPDVCVRLLTAEEIGDLSFQERTILMHARTVIAQMNKNIKE